MQIFEMSFEDLEAVNELGRQLGYPNSIDEFRERFSEIYERKDFRIFVAKNGKKVLGWIQVNQELPTILAPARAEVSALVVDEMARGQGVGAALLKAAEEWVRTLGIDFVRVRTNVNRTDAHKFYEKQGYENVKSWRLYTKKMTES